MESNVIEAEVVEEGAGVASIIPSATTKLLRPLAPPDQVIEAHKEAVALIERALEHGTDYGRVPGTDKDTLLKPGAERLCGAYGVVPTYEVVEKEIDHDRLVTYKTKKWVETDKKPDKATADAMKLSGVGRWKLAGESNGRKQWVWIEREDEEGESQGLYRYVVRCSLVSRGEGRVVGDGLGSCSTMESKYIRQPRDLENTILKMAEKRALIAATLNAFGLSDRFTQDVEDMNLEAPQTPKQTANKVHTAEDPDRWAKDWFVKNVSNKRSDWNSFASDATRMNYDPASLIKAYEKSEPKPETLWAFVESLDADLIAPSDAELFDGE